MTSIFIFLWKIEEQLQNSKQMFHLIEPMVEEGCGFVLFWFFNPFL